MRLFIAIVAAAVIAACSPPQTATANDAGRIAALPLVEAPSAGRGDALAVFYSGDGGWAFLDRGVAGALARGGTPVVGIDSLRYFWTQRSPEEAAADLAAVLRHYMAAWKKSRVILAGYSFGAGALPAIVQHLPPDLRERVRLMALVGAPATGELEFHPREWLTQAPTNGFSVAPILTKLQGLPMICIYGSTEKRDACPAFPAGLMRQVGLPGDHHFNGDYAAVAAAILREGGI